MKGDVKIPSRSSPKGSKRGCLCWDTNTYSRKCCDGSLRAQGVGSFQGQGSSTIISYDVDYANILNYAEQKGYTTPSQAQKTLQNQLIVDLKKDGIWGSFDYFYMFATDGDSDFATINWKDPNKYQATKVGSTIFASNSGFKSDGSSYLNTNFIPYSDAEQMTPTNSSNGVWLLNALDVSGGTEYIPYGAYKNVASTINKGYNYGIRAISGWVFGDSNTAQIVSFIEPYETVWTTNSISGHIHISTKEPKYYTDATLSWYQTNKIYSNGSLVNSRYRQLYTNVLGGEPVFPTSYSSPNTREIYVGATNRFDQDGFKLPASNFFTDYISLHYGGASIDDKANELYTALNSYMGSI